MWLSQSTCLTAPTLPPLSVPPRPSSHLLSFLSLCRGPPAIHETLLLLFVTPFLLLPMLFLSPPLHYDLCPSLSHPSPLSVPRAYATPPPSSFTISPRILLTFSHQAGQPHLISDVCCAWHYTLLLTSSHVFQYKQLLFLCCYVTMLLLCCYVFAP